MALGFQPGAFQSDAFQLDTGTPRTAFQRGAFQFGAFQVMEAATTEPERSVPGKRESGGYQGPQQRYRTEEEKHQRRIELGILPQPVQKAIEKSVRRVINKAKAEERAQPQGVNPLIYLRHHHEQEREALAHELRKRDLQFDIQYMALVRWEVERLAQEMQDAEDEQIVMLLMEM